MIGANVDVLRIMVRRDVVKVEADLESREEVESFLNPKNFDQRCKV